VIENAFEGVGMKKIKVLQFPIAQSKGGTTQYTLRNWKYVDKNKFHYDFVTMSSKLDFAEELERDGCKIFYISTYAEDDREQFEAEFRKILVEGQYDIIHLATNQWKSFAIEKIAKEVGIKKIIIYAQNGGINTDDEEKRNKELTLHYKMREQLTEDIATDFWACSRAAADFLYGEQIPKNKIKLVKNAINMDDFVFDSKIRNQYRKELDVEQCYVLGNVGRLAYQKNQEFLLSVFKKLCEIRDDYKLLLIGSGELEQTYKDYVRNNGLEDKVVFLGQRKDVNNLLQAIDCFCLPSRFEGLPIAMVEAQTSGVRCVCSDLITDEVCLSDLAARLPLDEDEWVRVIDERREFDRGAYAQIIRDAGYDWKDEILKIQEEYMRIKEL